MKRHIIYFGLSFLFLAIGSILALCSLGSLAAPGQSFTADQQGIAPHQPATSPVRAENVFIVVIDGLRTTEAFEDPTHEHIPRIWNDLRPLGTIYMNFLNLGFTQTTGGHSTIMSGVTQYLPNAKNENLGILSIRTDEPSVFQYYRSTFGIPENKTWNVSGKGTNTLYVGVCRNPYYQEDHAPLLSFGHEFKNDNLVWAEMQNVIDAHHPSMTLLNLGTVDGMGHTGDWDLYTQAIENADRIVFELHEKIRQDPFYRDNTILIVTSDHGRHLDGVLTGFKDHSCTCLGCRRIPFLIIGPNVQKNKIVSKQRYLRDIAPTIGALLDIPMPFCMGEVMRELFVLPPPKENPAMIQPGVACAGNGVFITCCRRSNGASNIVFSSSDDGGATWSNFDQLNDGGRKINTQPCLAAHGDRVGIAWVCYEPGSGSLQIAVRESADKGITWSPIVYMDGEEPLVPDLLPSVCYQDGYLTVVWQEVGLIGHARIQQARLQDGIVLSRDTLYQNIMTGLPCCAPSPTGTHVIFNRMNEIDLQWDVIYSFCDSNGEWTNAASLSPLTLRDALNPDIAFDSSGVHTVWDENENGISEIVFRNSPDGLTWDPPVVLSNSPIGAWRPRIGANDNLIAVVWEEYQDESPSIYGATSSDGGITWSSPFPITLSLGKNYLPDQDLTPLGTMSTISMEDDRPAAINITEVQF